MLLSAGLRLPGLSDVPLTNDESYAWRVTQYPLLDWLERTRHDASPPFSYLVLQLWQLACGSSVWALRGLSVLLAVLTVPLTYGACIEALRLGSRANLSPPEAEERANGEAMSFQAGAFLSAFLVAVHPSQVVQGRNARMYALGVFLTALTSWLLLKGLRDNRQRWWVGYGLTAAALALTQYYGLFTLAAQGLFAGGWLLLQVFFPRLRVGLVWEGGLAEFARIPMARWRTEVLRLPLRA